MFQRLLLSVLLLGLPGGLLHAQRVELRTPRRELFELPAGESVRNPTTNRWLTLRRPGFAHPVEFSRRLVVRTHPNTLTNLPSQLPEARVLRRVDAQTWIFDTDSPGAALALAMRLGNLPGIEMAVPARKRQVRPHEVLAAVPNDPYFTRQYSIESFDSSASFLGATVDLNARSAWAWTRGENVIVGVSDDGIESTHPDLQANMAGPNHNFLNDSASGEPVDKSLFHGTAVAGLIAAVDNNRKGLSGVAPRAKLASWVIFDETDTNQPDEVGFAEMFGTANETVGVQNHSWGNADFSFVVVSLLEHDAIGKAVTEGRGGRGVVMIRSAGNTRQTFAGGRVGDANLDGYANDPRQISVGAVRTDGHVTSYSTPGACVLVAAPGGDFRGGYPGLVTTDRAGINGLNGLPEPGDPTSWDYLVGTRLFVGTSASAPLVSGLAALVVSARPELRWNEIQQVLALSARHLDFADAELRTNAAGLRFSPNTGFGIPDAGTALRLARSWPLRPPLQSFRQTNSGPREIPDPLASSLTVPLTVDFDSAATAIVQHVQVRVRWSHPRGDQLKLAITSPSGLTSVLLRTNTAGEPVPADWTFSTVAHLGESSHGTWRFEVTDTVPGTVGTVEEAELILDGVPIQDQDHDGLYDDWERGAFGDLSSSPQSDPDGDGWTNAAEQLAGRNPVQRDEEFAADAGREADGRVRFTWPGTAAERYEVWRIPFTGAPASLVTNVPGRFPEAGWRSPVGASPDLFEIRRSP